MTLSRAMPAALPAYKCSLTREEMGKAKRELQENPRTRSEDVQLFREKIQTAKPRIRCSLDDAFLLRFLRARKFDQDRAYSLFRRYIEVRSTVYPETFTDFLQTAVKPVMDTGMFCKMAEKAADGTTLFYARPGRWSPSQVELSDILNTIFLQIDAVTQEESVQVHGLSVIVDMTGVGFSQCRHMTPSLLKKVSSLLQDSVPVRVKSLVHVNMPRLFETLVNLFKTFWKGKLQKRFHVFSSSESLYKMFPKTILPITLGGEADEKTCITQWTDQLMALGLKLEEEIQHEPVNDEDDHEDNLDDESESDDEPLRRAKLLDRSISETAGSFHELEID